MTMTNIIFFSKRLCFHNQKHQMISILLVLFVIHVCCVTLPKCGSTVGCWCQPDGGNFRCQHHTSAKYDSQCLFVVYLLIITGLYFEWDNEFVTIMFSFVLCKKDFTKSLLGLLFRLATNLQNHGTLLRHQETTYCSVFHQSASWNPGFCTKGTVTAFCNFVNTGQAGSGTPCW